jgi:hypothetical protein
VVTHLISRADRSDTDRDIAPTAGGEGSSAITLSVMAFWTKVRISVDQPSGVASKPAAAAPLSSVVKLIQLALSNQW